MRFTSYLVLIVIIFVIHTCIIGFGAYFFAGEEDPNEKKFTRYFKIGMVFTLPILILVAIYDSIQEQITIQKELYELVTGNKWTAEGGTVLKKKLNKESRRKKAEDLADMNIE